MSTSPFFSSRPLGVVTDAASLSPGWLNPRAAAGPLSEGAAVAMSSFTSRVQLVPLACGTPNIFCALKQASKASISALVRPVPTK